jgi:hypothetical protein
MKTLFMICLAAALLGTPAILMAASCDSGESGYFITVTFQGETSTVRLGYTDVGDGDAFASAMSEGETNMLIMFGTNEEVASTSWGLSTTATWVLLAVEGTSTGAYLYSAEAMQAYIGVGGDIYRADSGSVVITSSGDVGGDIEGTFTIDTESFSPESGGYHAFAGMPATGSFRVKRAGDDLELPF